MGAMDPGFLNLYFCVGFNPNDLFLWGSKYQPKTEIYTPKIPKMACTEKLFT